VKIALKQKKVTIIVPVYSDWTSLFECIESIKAHTNPDNCRVILVDDCGPESEQIEQNIKKIIEGNDNFSYHRNPHNLGFPKTCNRAVFELDDTNNDILLLNSDAKLTHGSLEELFECLYDNKKNGIVAPRSNNSTLSSIPFQVAFRRNWNTVEDEMNNAYNTYKAVSEYMPKYSIAPVSPGFCILIRRDVIERFGLFDEIFGKGYGEEDDFCMRIASHGFRSLISNHAFVYHYGSRSFSVATRNISVLNNEKIVKNRYPNFQQSIEDYIHGMNHYDWFADVISNKQRQRILVNLIDLKLENKAALLMAKQRLKDFVFILSDKNVDYVVVCDEDFHKHIGGVYPNMIFIKSNEISDIFHLGYCPMGVTSRDQINMLQRSCLLTVSFSQASDQAVVCFEEYTDTNLRKIKDLISC